MKKTGTFILFVLGISVILSGCNNTKVYREEEMSHFYTDKTAIEDITSIEVNSEFADISFVASDDFYIEYSYYYIKNQPKLTIKDGNLIFSDAGMNGTHYSINQSESNYLKIYIPAGTNLSKVEIEKSSGDCSIGNFITKELDINCSYGDVIVSDCQAKNIRIVQSSGGLTLDQISMENMKIENDYGDVSLSSIDMLNNQGNVDLIASSGMVSVKEGTFSDLTIDIDYGDCELDQVLVDQFKADLSSGSVNMSGRVEKTAVIQSDYGDVTLFLEANGKEFGYDLNSSYGTIKVGDITASERLEYLSEKEKEIIVTTSSGNIELNFQNDTDKNMD